MNKKITIHWFRQDLRLTDNPALRYAVKNGIVIPVYILDNFSSGVRQIGSAGKCWLHYSLVSLNHSLNGQLLVYCGNPEAILNEIIKKYNADAVTWNRCYEPLAMARDSKIKQTLSTKGISINSFNGSLLWEPWEVLKKDKTPYRVFTPFYANGCLRNIEPRVPQRLPENINYFFNTQQTTSQDIDRLNLLPQHRWGEKIISLWNIGEKAALEQLKFFISNSGDSYTNNRDFPSKSAVSKLSTYLHFGELSPNQAWYASYNNDNFELFRRQLVWREFSYNLLYYHPKMYEVNLQSKFDKFPWKNDEKFLTLWKNGQTGIPIVDAGMRELWQTGYMHNRVRMIVGSFLVKNLMIDWRCGEKWFWGCLLDADLANNAASWQWVAGSGMDAAPYYRIFNPIIQGQKFDSDGIYTRKYVPELAKLPNKYLFNPWEASENILKAAEVKLGENYPYPIVNIKLSRENALKAFNSL